MSGIYITKFDFERLVKLLDKRKPHDQYDEALNAELLRAEIVEQEAIPADIITMNSQVQFKDDNGDFKEYTLVFPEDADLSSGKISILSPVGCSLIGYKVGSTITLPTPGGRKHLKVEKILYQPESAGDFNL